VKFALIAAEKACYPVRVLCRTLEVSRAGFYAWHTRPPAPRTQQDQRLGVEIQAIHAERRQRYGGPRVHAVTRPDGLVRRHGDETAQLLHDDEQHAEESTLRRRARGSRAGFHVFDDPAVV
jgi:putative transposase